MPLTDEQIRRRLVEFARRWDNRECGERAEAQTFLNELFECYGQRRQDVARFEDAQHGRFLDLFYPGVCIVEMKASSETPKLSTHRRQAIDYWLDSADVETDLKAPPYVVLCSFHKFEVWEPGSFPKQPRTELTLAELPDRWDSLSFLAGREPVFAGGSFDLTKDAVAKIARLNNLLQAGRTTEEAEQVNHFVFQCLWCMFAEDLGMLPNRMFSRLLKGLLDDPGRSSVDELGQLFQYLNDPSETRPEAGKYKGTPYANGGLFALPSRVHLKPEEVELLLEAAQSDWAKVDPSVFGGLLEGGLARDKKWQLGAHYTHEVDIQKIVQPTIVRPWRDRIAAIKTHDDAVAAQRELLDYVVLDPACGSGNFLYVAYRELRLIERRVNAREAKLREAEGKPAAAGGPVTYPLENIKGIEYDGFAVELAKVTLWMGHKLAVEEIGADEATLPLAKLDGIVNGDALKVEWPRADAIIGNPPFHGAKLLRRVLGDQYVDWLDSEFKCGLKDYCVYWYRLAHDRLEPGKRAGLVGTNSISQNTARSASLQYIVDNGGVITDAVSSQVWPGDAAVHVSIVNWVKEPKGELEIRILDGVELGEAIAPSLRPDSLAVDKGQVLGANAKRSFIGPVPGASGYVISEVEALSLLKNHGDLWKDVIRPYLVGEDLTSEPLATPSRWIIDFAARTLEEAGAYSDALAIVRERAKPEKDKVKRTAYRENWWRFSEPIRDMRIALKSLGRYIACAAQAKRIMFAWQDVWTCPSNATVVFAFDDDYSFGVLTSRIHTEWARAQSSTLKSDIRYTPTTAFATFPWPDPTDEQRAKIGDLAKQIVELRSQICTKNQYGLTKLYNAVDDGAYADFRKLHEDLDKNVAAAYGWPKKVAQDADECNRRLLALNLKIAAGELEYDPFPARSGSQMKLG